MAEQSSVQLSVPTAVSQADNAEKPVAPEMAAELVDVAVTDEREDEEEMEVYKIDLVQVSVGKRASYVGILKYIPRFEWKTR